MQAHPPKDSPHIGQQRKRSSACSKRCKLTILISRHKMCRRRNRRKLGNNADPNAFERTTGEEAYRERIQRRGSWCVVTCTGRREEAEVKERLANWAPLRIARRAVKHNPARSYAYAALAEQQIKVNVPYCAFLKLSRSPSLCLCTVSTRFPAGCCVRG